MIIPKQSDGPGVKWRDSNTRIIWSGKCGGACGDQVSVFCLSKCKSL